MRPVALYRRRHCVCARDSPYIDKKVGISIRCAPEEAILSGRLDARPCIRDTEAVVVNPIRYSTERYLTRRITRGKLQRPPFISRPHKQRRYNSQSN